MDTKQTPTIEQKYQTVLDNLIRERVMYMRLRKELEHYKAISRAVYELTDISNLENWIDNYKYGEGVDPIEHLKTLVECTQNVTDKWSYHEWGEWIKENLSNLVEK